MERPLSAARKASFEERDPEEMACRVHQAIQRENIPVQSPEPLSRNTVRLPHTVLLPPLLNSGILHDKTCFSTITAVFMMIQNIRVSILSLHLYCFAVFQIWLIYEPSSKSVFIFSIVLLHPGQGTSDDEWLSASHPRQG